MQLKAIKIDFPKKEKNREIFLCSLKIKDLIDETKIAVDYWKDEKRDKRDQGYQRAENPSHVNRIRKSIFDNGIDFPTSILLSYRREENRPPDYSYNEKTNELNLRDYPIYLVDGQHRRAGIKNVIEELKKSDSSIVNKELSAVLLVGVDKYEEMQYFETINSTAKRVPTDLANELLVERAQKNPDILEQLKVKNKIWLVKAIKIAHALNERIGSPWHKRIRMPNQPKNVRKETIAGQSQFASSLRVILENGFLRIKSLDENIEIIDTYWMALRELFPQAFQIPKKHVIQKTVGIFSLHLLLNSIIPVLMNERKELNQKQFEKILTKIFEKCDLHGFGSEHENSKFWQSGRRDGAAIYRGQAGFKELYAKFMEEGLEEN